MIEFTLASKEDVNVLKKKLRNACDTADIRVGRSDKNIETILAHLFGYKDFNTLLGVASKIQEPTSIEPPPSAPEPILLDLAERIDASSTTYDGRDAVIKALKQASGVRYILFATRNGGFNESATSILLVADSGNKLLDTTSMTVERSPRELEVLEVFRCIKKLSLLDKAFYVTERVSPTKTMPPKEAVHYLLSHSVTKIRTEWVGFLAMYDKNLKRYGRGAFYADSWDEIMGSS